MNKVFIVYVKGNVEAHDLATKAWGEIKEIDQIIVNEIVGAKNAEIISHQTQVK